MFTKTIEVTPTSLITFRGLSHGQSQSSGSYSFCGQSGSCGANNQDGTQVLCNATTLSLSSKEVEA